MTRAYFRPDSCLVERLGESSGGDQSAMHSNALKEHNKNEGMIEGATMNDRLTKEDWIRHGLRTLANEGAHALKVGPMATKLKVSRGSFYWHFRDIPDFR